MKYHESFCPISTRIKLNYGEYRLLFFHQTFVFYDFYFKIKWKSLYDWDAFGCNEYNFIIQIYKNYLPNQVVMCSQSKKN